MARDFLGDVSRLMGSISPIASRKTVAPSASDIKKQIESKVIEGREGKLKATKLFGDDNRHLRLRTRLRELQEEYLIHRNMIEQYVTQGVGQGAKEQLTLQALELQEKHHGLMKEIERLTRDNDGILFDDSIVDYKTDRTIEKKGAMSKEEWDYLYETLGHVQVGMPMADGQTMSFGDWMKMSHDVSMDKAAIDDKFVFFDGNNADWGHEIIRDKEGTIIEKIDRRGDPIWLSNFMTQNIMMNETLLSSGGKLLESQINVILDNAKLNREEYMDRQKLLDEDRMERVKIEKENIVLRIGECMKNRQGFTKAPDVRTLEGGVNTEQSTTEFEQTKDVVTNQETWTITPGETSINKMSFGKCRDSEILEMERNNDFRDFVNFDKETAQEWLSGNMDLEQMFGDPTDTLAEVVGGTPLDWNFTKDYSVEASAYHALVNKEVFDAFIENEEGFVYVDGEDELIPTHTENGRINPKAYTMVLSEVQKWQQQSQYDLETGMVMNTDYQERLRFTGDNTGKINKSTDPLFFSASEEQGGERMGSLEQTMLGVVHENNFSFTEEVDGEMKSDYGEFTKYSNMFSEFLPTSGSWTQSQMANSINSLMAGSDSYVDEMNFYAQDQAVNPNAAGQNGIEQEDLNKSLRAIEDEQAQAWENYSMNIDKEKPLVDYTHWDFDEDPLSMTGYYGPWMANATKNISSWFSGVKEDITAMDVKVELGEGVGFGDIVTHDDWNEKFVNDWRSRLMNTQIGDLNLPEMITAGKGMYTDPKTGRSVNIIDPLTGNVKKNWRDEVKKTTQKGDKETPPVV